MKKLLLILIFATFAFAQVNYAAKKPTFDNPRQWLIRVNNSNIQRINHILNSVNNVLKGYPDESLQVELIFYGNGIRALRKDFDENVLKRVKSLMVYENIEFVICKNTMDTMGWHKKDFISGASYVQIGIAEAIERVADGWIDVSPY